LGWFFRRFFFRRFFPRARGAQHAPQKSLVHRAHPPPHRHLSLLDAHARALLSTHAPFSPFDAFQTRTFLLVTTPRSCSSSSSSSFGRLSLARRLARPSHPLLLLAKNAPVVVCSFPVVKEVRQEFVEHRPVAVQTETVTRAIGETAVEGGTRPEPVGPARARHTVFSNVFTIQQSPISSPLLLHLQNLHLEQQRLLGVV
jgi:hypothetical protein